MNLEFLKNEIIPKREKEIEEWKNLATRQPIYIVYDVDEYYTTYDEQYSCLEMCSYKEISRVHGRVVDDGDQWEFIEDNEDPELTKFYKDRYVAIFLTSEAAYDYMKYQSHNLSKRAYVYVEYTWYANRQMDLLLENK